MLVSSREGQSPDNNKDFHTNTDQINYGSFALFYQLTLFNGLNTKIIRFHLSKNLHC